MFFSDFMKLQLREILNNSIKFSYTGRKQVYDKVERKYLTKLFSIEIDFVNV